MKTLVCSLVAPATVNHGMDCSAPPMSSVAPESAVRHAPHRAWFRRVVPGRGPVTARVRRATPCAIVLMPTPTEVSMNIGPGDALPDYELPDHENVPRRLSELQADDPMILTLARGHYCPK